MGIKRVIGLASSWKGRNCPVLERGKKQLLGLIKGPFIVVETLPGDLMQLLDNIEIYGIVDRPEPNDLCGTIQSFDEMKCAYIINLRSHIPGLRNLCHVI